MELPSSVFQACALYEFKSGFKPIEATERICTIFGADAISEDSVKKYYQKYSSGNETIEDEESDIQPSKKKTKLKYNSPYLSKSLIRACLLYEYKSGVKAAEATRKICSTFGKGAVSERCSRAWFQKFAFGLETLVDAPRSGRPSFINDLKLKDAIEANTKQTCQELADQFNVCDETIRNHLHRLGKSWKLNKCLPKEIGSANKQARLNICSALLSRHKNGTFIEHILTYGETWAQYSKSKRSYQSSLQDDKEQQKVLLCVWWTSKGVVHYEFLETEKAVAYTIQLEQVSAALRHKQPTLADSKTVLFQQETERPHKAKEFSQAISKLGWELLPHPPFSPDLIPSDYYLFPALETHLQHKTLRTSEDVKNETKKFFESRDVAFFKSGLENLPIRWERVLEVDGDYFAK